MTAETLGLAINERMIGYLRANEESESESEASNALRDQSNQLIVQIQMKIDKLGDFMASSCPSGTIEGQIHYEPFQDNIKIDQGKFCCFLLPPKQGPHTFMVYEFPFGYNQKEYCIRCDKIVQRGKVASLWSDTTTFHTSLIEGPSDDARVIANGMLHLTLPDFFKLVSSMRISNSSSILESIWAITTFVRFFLAQLWKIYGTSA